jgi:hypothetical protein
MVSLKPTISLVHTTAQMALGSDFCILGLLDMKLRAWTLGNSDLLLLFHHMGHQNEREKTRQSMINLIPRKLT